MEQEAKGKVTFKGVAGYQFPNGSPVTGPKTDSRDQTQWRVINQEEWKVREHPLRYSVPVFL